MPTLLGDGEGYTSVRVRREWTGGVHPVTAVVDEICEIFRELGFTRAAGPEIETDARFPARTNVEFVQRISATEVRQRTWERGSGETLACGTGCVASALVTAGRLGWSSPVPVTTRSGGVLTIHFERDGDRFRDVYLEGDARIVYTGEIKPDAMLA